VSRSRGEAKFDGKKSDEEAKKRRSKGEEEKIYFVEQRSGLSIQTPTNCKANRDKVKINDDGLLV
jgi:hypothetical protein